MFVSKCLTSDNSLVNFVARHSVYVLRQNSPVVSNALWCCMRFGLRLDMLKLINRNFVSRLVSTELHAYNVAASVIMWFVVYQISSGWAFYFRCCWHYWFVVCRSPILCSFVFFQFFFVFFCVLLYDFIINK